MDVRWIMRYLAAFIILGHVTAVPLALAEAWRTKPALEPEAPPGCKDADVSNLFLDLSHTGDELSIKTNSGEAFFVPIGKDGYVTTTISVRVGKRKFAVELSGNVKTREIEVMTAQHGCRFRLIPVS